uniref:Uncharacterized protein n=1 Tax=Stomoxys calcitrans TaxID=35570 RepID=A0A1I8Q475_STOCA
MIICGNIYFDEMNKTFVMQCVICEKKSKAYTEFTKHIKKKHKTLDAEDRHRENLVSITPPPQTLVKREDQFDPEEYEEEKPLIQIKHDMEMEILDGLSDVVKYDIIEPVETAVVDPMALDENETLDLAEIANDFDIKDEDYVPENDNDSEDDCENYDEENDGASSETDENEEMPVSDKTFLQIQAVSDRLAPWLREICSVCINMSFKSVGWRNTKFIFIPQAGKPCNTKVKNFRPISLSS